MKQRTLSLVLSALLMSSIMSCNSGTPDITLKSPHIVGKRDAAIFLLIINDGNASDYLTGCSIGEWPGARVEVHDIIDGVMQEVKEIKIPAHDIVVFKKGSYHVMVFGVPENGPHEATLSMNFKKSGTKEVKVTVR